MDKRKEIIKYRFSNPQKAYNICCELLEEGILSGNDYEIAYAYLYMGDTLFSMEKIDEALKYMSKAETIQKQNGFDNLLMRTYNIIGVIYHTIGDALLSIEYYHRALNLGKKHKNIAMVAMLYNNIGELLFSIGDSDKAVEYYKSAYSLTKNITSEEKEQSVNMVMLYMNICEGYLNKKKYVQAKKYLENVVIPDISDSKISNREKMRIVHMYAMIYYNLNDYDKAYDMCMKAHDLCNLSYQDIEVFEDYVDIIDILVNTDNIEQVEKMLVEMDKIAEKTDIDNRKLQICNIRIQLYKKTGNQTKLKEQLQKYYTIRKKINSERNQIIIAAIDNRCRLEEERKQNQLLNEENMKLLKESEIDELTGIYNRLAFKIRYDKLYRYALQNKKTYCIGIFDIDNFKTYNDTYGHLKGDKCLKRVAQILSDTSDGDFCVARYGGDEFIFMACDISEDDVRKFAGNLVENIRREKIPFVKQKTSYIKYVTISVGAIIQYDAVNNTDLTEMIKNADKVLYEVKQAGKDGYKIYNL